MAKMVFLKTSNYYGENGISWVNTTPSFELTLSFSYDRLFTG